MSAENVFQCENDKYFTEAVSFGCFSKCFQSTLIFLHSSLVVNHSHHPVKRRAHTSWLLFVIAC